MPRKNRGYKKGEAFRDSRIIAIACEGLREAEYFRTLVGKSQRLKLVLLEPKDAEQDKIQRSSPKWMKDRAAKFIDEVGLFGKNEDDELWFVLDIDHWEKSILHEISKDCKVNLNWSMALSNPCFEVWLYAHIGNPKELEIKKGRDLKTLLHKDYKGGYQVELFIKMIENAIVLSKNNDSDFNSDFPNLMETKVYRLAESIINSILK